MTAEQARKNAAEVYSTMHGSDKDIREALWTLVAEVIEIKELLQSEAVPDLYEEE